MTFTLEIANFAFFVTKGILVSQTHHVLIGKGKGGKIHEKTTKKGRAGS